MNDKEQANTASQAVEKKQEKANWNIKPYLAVALLSFIVICLCMAVFFVLYRFNSVKAGVDKVLTVLQPIIIGMVIAYLINPVMKFIERNLERALKTKITDEKKRNKLTRAIGTAGALLFFILIIVVLISMMVPQLIKSIMGMVTNLPKQADAFLAWLDSFLKGDNQWASMLEEAVRKGMDVLSNWFEQSFLPQLQTYITEITSGVISGFKVLLNALIGLIVAVYVLFSKEKFIGQAKKIVYAVFPVRQANAIVHTVRKSNEIFGGFISGKILDSAIIGVLCYIVLSIMRMPYSLLVSVIVGVTNIIPFFGPFIGAVPSAIIITLASPLQGLYFIIFVIILQQVDGNIIGPKILGDSTGLSPFWVVFAILLGGGLFGFAGMVLGVPTFAVIYYIISKVVSYILRKRKLPENSASYTKASGVDLGTNQIIYMQEKEDICETSQSR